MNRQCTLVGADEWGQGHHLVEGTDLEIAYNLVGDGLVIRVNKGPWQVLRVMLQNAVPRMDDVALLRFNSVSPDFTFRVGDTNGRMRALARSVGLDAAQLAKLEKKLGIFQL